MRFVYIALIVLFTAAVLLFKFQNLDMVTVSLLSARITLPISVLIVLVYALGMASGRFVLALLRGLVRGARRPPHELRQLVGRRSLAAILRYAL